MKPQILLAENQDWNNYMAIYISITKLTDNNDFADYSFSDNDKQSGVLRLIKSSGKIELLTALPNDEKESFYQRAAYKVKKHWEAGELPEKTCWAS